MASLDFRDGRYNIIFRFGGKRFTRSLRTDNEDTALSKKLRLEENIQLIESGRLEVPDDADVPTFLLSDGKLSKKPTARSRLTPSQLFAEFFERLPEGHLEPNTISLMKIHQRHLERGLGKQFNLQSLAAADLQKYITKRSKHKTRKGTVGGGTIRKEVATLRSTWKWAVANSLLNSVFPADELRYPKTEERPPFQTWQEIERQIAMGASTELWESLYLSMNQIAELLRNVKRYAAFPFIHPMFVCAAYTGARRSELMRSQLSDIDLQSKVMTIREKKRVRGKSTTRRVPVSPPLSKVLNAWVEVHPGGSHTFCHDTVVIERSRKSKERANGPIALTGDEANCHFRQTVDDSKWEVMKGWHCLRHSFISNCASKGIDQRMIDEWVGHTTESMRRRYRHLFPSTQQNAMDSLFS